MRPGAVRRHGAGLDGQVAHVCHVFGPQGAWEAGVWVGRANVVLGEVVEGEFAVCVVAVGDGG